MEIKIIISDTGAGGTVLMQINGESVSPATGVETGALDAGLAPNAGGSAQFGAPPPFISGNALGDVTTSPAVSAGASAAAKPVSGSVVESVAFLIE